MLTDEQRRLVEDNHDLIYWFMTKHKLDFDTFYSYAAEGLCRAAAAYNTDKGEFSTFAHRCMLNAVRSYRKDKKRTTRDAAGCTIVSLQSKAVGSDGEEIEIGELLVSIEQDTDDWIDAKDALKRIISALDSRSAKIVMMKAYGYTNQEIADHIGVSRERIRQIRVEAWKKIAGG